jgi:hypothetical protein
MSKDDFKIVGSVISNKVGDSVALPFPVGEIVELNDVLIARLQIPEDVVFNENVYGLHLNLEIKWQVPSRHYMLPNAPYTEIRVVGALVRMFGWDSITVDVDPNSGTIVNKFVDR